MGRRLEVGAGAVLVGLLGGVVSTAVLGGSDPMAIDGDPAGCFARFGQPSGHPEGEWSVGGGGFPPRYTCIDGNGQVYDVLSETAVWLLCGIAAVSTLVFLGGCAYVVLVLVTAERPAEEPDRARRPARAHLVAAGVLGAVGTLVALLVAGLAWVFVTPLLLPWVVAGFVVFAVVGATSVDGSLGPGGGGPLGHWRRGAVVGVGACVLLVLFACLLAPLLASDVALVVAPLLVCAGGASFALPVAGQRLFPR